MPFRPGQSGNPGGRPLGLIAEIRDKFKGDAIKILETFRDVALGEDPPGWETFGSEGNSLGIPASVRQRCGQEVIDRCLGKAPQTITIDDAPTHEPVDLSALSPDEKRMLAKLRFAAPEPPEDESDAPGSDVH